MRLLNTTTGELKWFDHNRDLPPYAILSHVWGDHEQTYEDIRATHPKEETLGTSSAVVEADSAIVGKIEYFQARHTDKNSTLSHIIRELKFSRREPMNSRITASKLKELCKYAASLGFEWVWVDTCCIDKASSAELSEAINSMFTWYSGSALCIAYLADVPDNLSEPTKEGSEFWRSRWFKRGWTLQELIAPTSMVFVSEGWKPFGTKATLAQTLEKITGIDAEVLTFRRRVSDVCIAEKMSWAAGRETKRPEDKAYSLQGLFGVYMTILYGEGMNAFRRLQEELLRLFPDQTLFAWDRSSAPLDDHPQLGLFAYDPACFYSGVKEMTTVTIEDIPKAAERLYLATGLSDQELEIVDSGRMLGEGAPIIQATPTFTITSHGIRAHIPIIRRPDTDGLYAIAVLAVKCNSYFVGLVLHRVPGTATLPEAHYAVGEHLARRYRLVLVQDSDVPALLPNGCMRDLGLARDDVIIGWEDIYIKPTEERTPNSATHIHGERTYNLVVPSWVFDGLGRQGFFLDTTEHSKSWDTRNVERYPPSSYHELSVLITAPSSKEDCQGIATLPFRYRRNSPQGESDTNTFRIWLQACWDESSGTPASVRVAVTFNDDANPTHRYLVLKSGAQQGGSQSYQDGETTVQVAFTPSDIPSTDTLDILLTRPASAPFPPHCPKNELLSTVKPPEREQADSEGGEAAPVSLPPYDEAVLIEVNTRRVRAEEHGAYLQAKLAAAEALIKHLEQETRKISEKRAFDARYGGPIQPVGAARPADLSRSAAAPEGEGEGL